MEKSIFEVNSLGLEIFENNFLTEHIQLTASDFFLWENLLQAWWWIDKIVSLLKNWIVCRSFIDFCHIDMDKSAE